MCGICGMAGRSLEAPPLDAAAMAAMTGVIAHRGPDDDGWHLTPGASLGARRLQVIDLAGSAQPLSNEDGSVWCAFNGEIYNYRELRDELRARGHRFSTDGDTETIVHLYEEHGPGFVEHLRGMFAIAVWDAPRRRLVLARDRMGVKPLYVSEGPRGLAFASEVKCLIAAGVLEPRLDPRSAELFLAWGFVPGPGTLFAGVRKLPPASLLVWEDGRLARERRYWNPWDHPPSGLGRSWEEDGERLLEQLRASVRARMVADVPVGAMLSGGLDSSLITALMAEAASGPVRTFAIGFAEDGEANELADARQVAARLGTEHHELLTSASDHPDLLDEAAWHLEEPIADLSQLGMLLLSRLARESVTVALCGQGADELLGGYRKHQIARLADVVARAPGPAAAALGTLGRRAEPGSTLARGLAALSTEDPAQRLLAMSRVVAAHEWSDLLVGELTPRPDTEATIARSAAVHAEPRARTALAQTLHMDTHLALVDNMLLYFDKMSMAASLEVRVPFLDHDVVAFCTALGDDRKVWRRHRKELLKRASAGLVDEAIIRKPKRGFFHAALGAWLRTHRDDLFTDVLLDARTRERGQFAPAAVRRLVAQAGQDGKKADQRLFCLLLLEQWQRQWVDGDAPGRRGATAARAQSAA